MNKKYIIGLAVLVLFAAAVVFFKFVNSSFNSDEPTFGSVGGEYNATTTIIGSTNVDTLIKTGAGTLGSVIITTAGNTVFDLFNATTTNVDARTGKLATSTILIAAFPASAAAGTYTFDVAFLYGLYFDVTAGTLGTTTITWR